MPKGKQAYLMMANQIMQESDKMMTDGTLPSMSFFDLAVASKHENGPPADEEIDVWIQQVEASGEAALLEQLPGPWRHTTTHEERRAVVKELAMADTKGYTVQLYAKWQKQYGDRGLASNIVVPAFFGKGLGSNAAGALHPRIVLANPEEAESTARRHVRKDGSFEFGLYDSVIATVDNDHWRKQREHLVEAFLPLSSLAEILPKSLERAKHCAERLAEMTATSGDVVDMNDFFLHEAQAQLQLALMGAPESLMDATNAPVRATFNGDVEKAHVGDLMDAMKRLMEMAHKDKSLALPSDGCPVRGPLSRAVAKGDMAASTNFGNMLLILFAGHDTTGHTMTWLLFELARHPEIQRELQKEVDAFFQELGDREPAYRDLSKLSLMDRCVTETLRLWPAVPNGTFRQFQFDDTVTGQGGKQVLVPKGTSVQIVNWSRHRNPDLWGQDVNRFNPHRSFEPKEVAHVGCPLAAISPQSDRFSPFAHAPRSCLGRNFAQMEMRLIMCYLLRRFNFVLAAPNDKLAGATLGATPAEDEFRGLSYATMGPMDMENKSSHWWGDRYYVGLKFHAKARALSAVGHAARAAAAAVA